MSKHAGQANAGRSAAEKSGSPPAAKPVASTSEATHTKAGNDSGASSGGKDVAPKTPNELQNHFGAENQGHGATEGSGTERKDSMEGITTAPSGCDGGMGGESGGGTAPSLPPQPMLTAASEVGEEIEGLDDFLREMQEQASADSECTVVLNAPRALTMAEESEYMLGVRSRYVRNVLGHKNIGVSYDAVTSEYVSLMPARYVGRNARDGGNGVEIGFLHVVFKTAGWAKTVLERFDKCCKVSTGGLDMEWGSEKHSARIATVGNVAWVMGKDAPEWCDIELTQNPVWRVAMSPIGISPSHVEMVQRWGRFAVIRLNGKLREWGVGGELGYVALRPVYSKGSTVAKGLVLTVEVLQEPWVVPGGVSLKDGAQVVRLLWIVAGVQRHDWNGKTPVRRPTQAPARPSWGGGSYGKGGSDFGKGSSGYTKGKGGKEGKGGKGGKDGKGGKVGGMQAEVIGWQQHVASFTGEAASRRNTLLQWWGPVNTCPMGLFFTVRHNRIAGCQQGHCKASAVSGRPLWPCGVPPNGDKERLVPEVLRPSGTAKALFGGGPCEVPDRPGSKKSAPVHRGSKGAAASAQRTVRRWETGEGGAAGTAGDAGKSDLVGEGGTHASPSQETKQEFFNRTGQRRQDGGPASVFGRLGTRDESVGEAGWHLPKKTEGGKEEGKKPRVAHRSAREARLSRADDAEGEEGEGEEPGDGSPRTEWDAADRAVDRIAARATAGEGEREGDSDSSDEGGGSEMLHVLESALQPEDESAVAEAGGRKRRAEPESEEERAAAMKSPRGDDDDEGLDDEIEEIDDMEDEEMGQD